MGVRGGWSGFSQGCLLACGREDVGAVCCMVVWLGLWGNRMAGIAWSGDGWMGVCCVGVYGLPCGIQLEPAIVHNIKHVTDFLRMFRGKIIRTSVFFD